MSDDRSILVDHVADWAQRAWDRFPSRYRGKQRIEALVRSFGDAAQMLEDLAYEVLVDTLLTNASGVTLDKLGAIAGSPRGPFTDHEYKQIIRARILANTCIGTVDDVVAVYEAATAPSEVRYWGHPPAGYRLTAFRQYPMSDARRRRVKALMASVTGPMTVSLCEAIDGSLRLGGDDLPNLNNALSRTL